MDTGDIEDHPGHGNLPSKWGKKSCNGNRNRNFCRVEYNVEIVDDQVILVARKQDLEKLERTKIPDNLIVDAKPVVAIIGGGAGKSVFPNGVVN